MARDIIYTGKDLTIDAQLAALQEVSREDIVTTLKQAWAQASHFTAG